MLIPNCTSGKDVYMLPQIPLTEGVGQLGPLTWFNPPKPGPQSRALWCCVCIVNSYGTLLNLPIDSLLFLFLFLFFSMFFVLIHDYTLCFTGSPYCIFSYCKFSYYNYSLYDLTI